jgi:signal peptidase I
LVEKPGATGDGLFGEANASLSIRGDWNRPFRENCIYTVRGIGCAAPPGHWMVMGGNRDDSVGSRM